MSPKIETYLDFEAHSTLSNEGRRWKKILHRVLCFAAVILIPLLFVLMVSSFLPAALRPNLVWLKNLSWLGVLWLLVVFAVSVRSEKFSNAHLKECRAVDTRNLGTYNFAVLGVERAWLPLVSYDTREQPARITFLSDGIPHTLTVTTWEEIPSPYSVVRLSKVGYENGKLHVAHALILSTAKNTTHFRLLDEAAHEHMEQLMREMD